MAEEPPTGLRIGRGLYERALAHLRAAAPEEAVGLLATDGADSDGAWTAAAFFPGTNVDASAIRYTMDPAEVLAALRAIEAHGWRLGAIVHSHPASPPTPSATDLREAHYPDALLLIVSFPAGSPVARAWRLLWPDGASMATGAVEVPVIVDRSPAPGREAAAGG